MKKLSIIKTLVVVFLAASLSPSVAQADGNAELVPQELRSADYEEAVAQLDPDVIPKLEPVSACGACDAHVSGKWTYFFSRKGAADYHSSIHLGQFGNSFKGVDSMHTMVGSLRGQWLNFTLVVTGEESEGWVMKVDASVDGDRITGVYTDSNGNIGSFVAIR